MKKKREKSGPMLVINKTTFEHKGSTYRLTGFYFVYLTSNNKRYYAKVELKNANAISGVGVGGCIVPMNEVKFLSRISKHPAEKNGHRYRLETEKYEFLKSLPNGLTDKEVDDRQMEEFFEKFIPNRRKV